MRIYSSTPALLLKCREARGFTLIEISIVLVVIGLLVGGILIGREMITQAQIRATVSQILEINTTVNTFRIKYNCLPGDCYNATMFFTATTQPEKVQNGNGDGQVAGVVNPAWSSTSTTVGSCGVNTYISNGADPNANEEWISPLVCAAFSRYNAAEWLNAWDSLAAANLAIGGLGQFDETTGEVKPGIEYPKLKAPVNRKNSSAGGIVFGYVPKAYNAFAVDLTPYITPGNKIHLGRCDDPATSSATCASSGCGGNLGVCGLNAWDAVQIDTKIDDGKPFTGAMVSLGARWPFRTAYTWGYINNGNETRGCGEAPEDLLVGGNRYQSESSWSALSSDRHQACALYMDAQF